MLGELLERHQVPGAQLVVRRGGETTVSAAGVLRLGGDPVTEDSAFPLGSITKPVTAMLVMALVEDGELDLDASLEEHLGPVHRDRTARQLLSHTAGLPATLREQDETLSRARWAARSHEAPFPPGGQFSYSNAGYVLAGHLAEVITGMTWRDAVNAIVLEPLGITPAAAVATGHTVRSGASTVALDGSPGPAIEDPAGGLALSAADLASLTGGSGPMCEDQLTGMPIGPFGMADGWGLGWARHRSWWGHDGTGDGTSAHVRFDPGTGDAVVLTTNAGTGPRLWQALLERLADQGMAVGDHPFSSLPGAGDPVPPPAGAAGRYANGDLVLDVTTTSTGDLALALGGRPYAGLTCFAGRRFLATELTSGRMTYAGRFITGAGDGITHVQISGRLSRKL
ncbi:serine hydrolase [Lentzea pudingi]|uniref:Serine hydrolase n=1 Tax=Lentzea pudingi TaxID=1789439 RepID=A0ABQ2IA53_9PSEU|nr:serine hydrolase domain-containing protein [Lentzea pudingi]GGN03903.1 serine hydrolase [Lentzea pudingi]